LTQPLICENTVNRNQIRCGLQIAITVPTRRLNYARSGIDEVKLFPSDSNSSIQNELSDVVG